MDDAYASLLTAARSGLNDAIMAELKRLGLATNFDTSALDLESWLRALPLEKAKGELTLDQLSEDQRKAWDKLMTWLPSSDPYFVLRGYPGTGKSTLMKLLAQLPHSFFFTAPTNKAAKVLTGIIGKPAKTTFSCLGLHMAQDEDELVMEYGRQPPYFPRKSKLTIDEASMVGQKLYDFTDKVRQDFGLKVLYVGDPAQLNPVKESRSPSWRATDDPACRAFLKKVMRFDSQLLHLSERIRDCMVRHHWVSPVLDDHDANKGVHLISHRRFIAEIRQRERLSDFIDTKVVAWRNRTVNEYNAMIRKNLGFDDEYNVGDLLLLAEPITEDGNIVAHIDDDFEIVGIQESSVGIRIEGMMEYIPVWALSVRGDSSRILNIPRDREVLDRILTYKSNVARKSQGLAKKAAWDSFWDTKNRFHAVRFNYALTAHRVQGTTLHTVFMDQQDILANPNKPEAFRALIVAATRPTTWLYTF